MFCMICWRQTHINWSAKPPFYTLPSYACSWWTDVDNINTLINPTNGPWTQSQQQSPTPELAWPSQPFWPVRGLIEAMRKRSVSTSATSSSHSSRIRSSVLSKVMNLETRAAAGPPMRNDLPCQDCWLWCLTSHRRATRAAMYCQHWMSRLRHTGEVACECRTGVGTDIQHLPIWVCGCAPNNVSGLFFCCHYNTLSIRSSLVFK